MEELEFKKEIKILIQECNKHSKRLYEYFNDVDNKEIRFSFDIIQCNILISELKGEICCLLCEKLNKEIEKN